MCYHWLRIKTIQVHDDFKANMCTCASLHVHVLISVSNVLNWGFPHVIKALSQLIQPNHTQHAFTRTLPPARIHTMIK